MLIIGDEPAVWKGVGKGLFESLYTSLGKAGADARLFLIGTRRRIDVLELLVGVRMDRAFLPFAHRLQSVAQAVEQPTHRGRAHAPSLLGQRRRQFRAALARPPQRRCRIPARQRIYERYKGRQNTRLVLLDSRTSGARSPNAARRRFTSCDLAASIPDRLPRQTGGRRTPAWAPEPLYIGAKISCGADS